MKLIWVTDAKYLKDYQIQLTFNDGTIKIFDGKDVVMSNPLFQVLRPLSIFRDFVLDGWTISWANGNLDLAPEYLYEHAVA